METAFVTNMVNNNWEIKSISAPSSFNNKENYYIAIERAKDHMEHATIDVNAWSSQHYSRLARFKGLISLSLSLEDGQGNAADIIHVSNRVPKLSHLEITFNSNANYNNSSDIISPPLQQ